MSFKTSIQGYMALRKQANGDAAGAKALYQQAYEGGLASPRPLLSYAVLLLRDGEYDKARELLKKIDKLPYLTPEQKQQVILNYAMTVYRQGELDRAITLLKRQLERKVNGTVYGALGYLLIEAGDFEEALALNTAALEYDEDDPVILDNLGQLHYRLKGDKRTAKQYFDRAIAMKSTMIDTLYFLAQYDIEEGRLEEAREKLEKALDGRFSPLNYVTKQTVADALAALPGAGENGELD